MVKLWYGLLGGDVKDKSVSRQWQRRDWDVTSRDAIGVVRGRASGGWLSVAMQNIESGRVDIPRGQAE